MAELGELLGFRLGLQGGGGGGATATATLMELLRESMSGSGRLSRRRTFRVRLGFNGLCGAIWGFGPSSNMSVREDDDDGVDGCGGGEDEGGGGSPEVGIEVANVVQGGGGSPEVGIEVANVVQTVMENGSTPSCASDAPAPSGMNLAAALAAERQFRAAAGIIQTGNGTALRVSLMKLLEETDGCDDGGGGGGEAAAGIDSLCCVCMVRKKGAAFIPCGHTFCRVCCRELWLNRGMCPLCNRSIVEILDIF